jgi:hypothetical protein
LAAQSAIGWLGLVARPEIGPSPADPLRRVALFGLQQSHGNRFVQRLVAASSPIRRCGGAIHAGCACAESGEPAGPAVRLQRLTAEEKAEDLKSSRYAGNPRLESAFDNTPPMKSGEKGEAVKAVQQGLIDDGFPMPVSTKKTGEPDGIYGGETVKAVQGFQKKHGLLSNGFPDGVVGRQTLGKLDELAGSGTPGKRVGPQIGDFEITGKSQADIKNMIFFEKDAAGFADDDEKAKVAPFVEPKDQDLELIGATSEEEKNPAALASARIATVTAQLKLGGHDVVAHVKATPEPTAGRGNRDYRGSRRVEISTGGAVPVGPKCQNDDGTPVPPQGPCDADTETKLKDAQKDAIELLEKGIDAIKAPLTPAGIAVLEATFGGKVPGAGKAAAPIVRLHLGQIKDHVKNLTNVGDPKKAGKGAAHNCGNDCDASCNAGAGAFNNGVGSSAVMTLCRGFKKSEPTLAAAILIHEASHGTAGLATKDLAGARDRAIDFLTADQAVRNADSYVNFTMRVKTQTSDNPTGTTLEKPPEDKLVGMDDNAADREAAGRALARVQRLVTFASQDIASLYAELLKAQRQGSWFDKNVAGFAPPLMDKVAPRFALTPTSKPPTDRDRFAIAAISDRYQRMADPLDGVAHTLTRDPAKTTSWENGPGKSVTLGLAFFTANPLARIDLLLAELVKATPGTSAGMVPEYVALTHDIENLFHL